jgi:hypothetical protein
MIRKARFFLTAVAACTVSLVMPMARRITGPAMPPVGAA